ncbi:hypothetical protein OS493_031202 [Desmophyllum pertusum]|uniref:Uncharacterized protein n=1 Tax=Desmophyllum pertusum TaxID=174260 RepID=A0A9W9ZJW0_9CNID|nr:hypothetical protein OS493_031202 [Desmophyllum pertusum]
MSTYARQCFGRVSTGGHQGPSQHSVKRNWRLSSGVSQISYQALEMASALIVVVNEDLTAEGRAEHEKESEDKTNSTGTTKSWETHSANSTSAVTMKRPLSLEDIQLLDNDPQENKRQVKEWSHTQAVTW